MIEVREGALLSLHSLFSFSDSLSGVGLVCCVSKQPFSKCMRAGVNSNSRTLLPSAFLCFA